MDTIGAFLQGLGIGIIVGGIFASLMTVNEIRKTGKSLIWFSTTIEGKILEDTKKNVN